MPDQRLPTRCIHAGELDDPAGSPQTPLYATTTFRFADTAALLDVIDGRRAGGLYTRYGMNPTITALEEKLASLESAEGALAFTSGMAALSSVFLAHGRRGIACYGTAYGGTLELLEKQLPGLGIRTHLLDADPAALEAVLREGCGLVVLETPTNPLLEVHDIQAAAELAHRYGALLAVDNTFATPVNQLPLALGADFSVHSATKYLGGHSDITAGAVMAAAALLEPIRPWRKNLGQVPAPEVAWLLARSLRTLTVRVRQHNANAQAIAEALRGHPRLRRVLYPGLADFPGHALARRQMSGFGGMLSIEVDGDAAETIAVVDRLRLFALAPSLGGAESLVTQPLTTTHHGMPAEERRRRGISDGLIRLSVGLEAAEDLIDDLLQALE